MDQLLNPVRILKESWEIAHLVYMNFVNLNKACENFPPSVLREYLWVDSIDM